MMHWTEFGTKQWIDVIGMVFSIAYITAMLLYTAAVARYLDELRKLGGKPPQQISLRPSLLWFFVIAAALAALYGASYSAIGGLAAALIDKYTWKYCRRMLIEARR